MLPVTFYVFFAQEAAAEMRGGLSAKIDFRKYCEGELKDLGTVYND